MFSQEKYQAMINIKQQFDDLANNPLSNIGLSVGLVNEEDYFAWRCTIFGPKDTPYSGGLFILRVNFPDDFPKTGPEVIFETPIYHVNINPKNGLKNDGQALGHVCINTLNWWEPYYTIREVLSNIYALFYRGNPESPYGLDRANELKNNKELYDKKCKYFTKKYAGVSRTNTDDFADGWDFTYDEKEEE